MTPLDLLTHLQSRVIVHSKALSSGSDSYWELHWRGFVFYGNGRKTRAVTRNHSTSFDVLDPPMHIDYWLLKCETDAWTLFANGFEPDASIPLEICKIADPHAYIEALQAFEHANL